MESILEAINEWIKEILIGAINGNLSTMFGDVNEKVGTIAAEVGKTPQGWNANIFSMIQNLSENVIVPIAGLVITYVLCYELISMVTEKNNMHDIETFMFFKWFFKAFVAVFLVTHTFDIINNHKRSLKAAFYTAIQDDCIRKNPFDFQLNTVLEDDTEPKEPLSPTQEAAFLSFVQHDKVYQKYYDEIIILLGTGLRISELCGLTEADIDLDKQLINVDHQLLKIADVGYYVETPKTKSGNRVIPMSEKVLEAFQRVLNKRKYAQPVILEGYTKFLFLNRNGLPKVAVNYESMFRGLVRKYNKTQKVALPKVMTPHTLRHTFCTTLANAGMNPKALQYIMGHSNINMTLNYYAHTTSETSITEMKRLIA